MTYAGGYNDESTTAALTTAAMIGVMHRVVTLTPAIASTAWPTANDAYLVPFTLAGPTTFTGAYFVTGTTPGTTAFDIGIYRDDFTLITSLGSTAAVNTSTAVMPVGSGAFATPVTLGRGRYFVAMSSASTALTVTASSTAANGTPRVMGLLKMASAHPLPTTFVPASMGTQSFIPQLGLVLSGVTIL